MIKFIHPNYQAAYSFLARRISVLEYLITNESVDEATIRKLLTESMEVIKSTEIAEQKLVFCEKQREDKNDKKN